MLRSGPWSPQGWGWRVNRCTARRKGKFWQKLGARHRNNWLDIFRPVPWPRWSFQKTTLATTLVCYEGSKIRYRAAVTAHNLGNFSWSHWGMTLAGMTVTAREIGSLGIFRKFRNNRCCKWQWEKRMKPEVLAGIFGKDKWQREVHPLTPGRGPGLWGKRKGWVWVW